MAIPPFPSQDLAKLVLGYLAEEQLMTAYDEFLQASPYLDALRNEYDRIFMTSLKSILAEYRAVKICVDTCKPFALRKKIFQCSNLLEVVKFLINNVDLKKIQEPNDKRSIDTHNSTITQNTNPCELCHSLSLASCVCKNRTNEEQRSVAQEVGSVQKSLEATPLDELPGNIVAAHKRNENTLLKDDNLNTTSGTSSEASTKQSLSSHISPEEYLARCENSPLVKNNQSRLNVNAIGKTTDLSKSSQNIEEFNKVLKSVVRRNKTLSSSENTNQRISNAGTFQDFSTGVTGGDSHSATYNIPDSSTSENLIRIPRKDVYNDNIKGPPQQLMLQVSHDNDGITINTCKTVHHLPIPQPKTTENQIKILSDIKVDHHTKEKSKSKKQTLHTVNATSTPLLNLQTIMINGTAAYRHTPTSHTFTKDEIMAMPTLIVVPGAGASQEPTSVNVNPIVTPSSADTPATNSDSPRVLGPLVIDVPPHDVARKTLDALPDLSDPKPIASDLVKTVDVKANGAAASVPKDSITTLASNTPQVLPPLRKSSSTPRRTSHVRVLDFTTPRRILHETINEVPAQTSNTSDSVTASCNEASVSTCTTVTEVSAVENQLIAHKEGNSNDTGSTKENESADITIKPKKKYDWDADLRALVANEKPPNISHRKPKKNTSKKKKTTDKASASKEPKSAKKKTRKKSPCVKKSGSRNEEELEEEPPVPIKSNIACKPNIKIISNDKSRNTQETNINTSGTAKNKSGEKDEETIETPETERLSLQNVIGAKLNISDFLETPYKQVLYDIQMETPKFLGADLPDVPISNVKITDIPTPRFLNTPKPPQATPSSYSSRPTDYSSGGSYYKPDDHDYMPVPDLFTCPVTSSKEDVCDDEKPVEEEKTDGKKSRPVRKCAKNVSYYKSSGAKSKEVTDNTDATSSCSDSVGANSSTEFRRSKEVAVLKTPRSKTSKSETKKIRSCKKKKSPKDSVVKDKTKSFMKIKPKSTPKKDTPVRSRKLMTVPACSSKISPISLQPRKRTSSKEKVNTVTLAVPAFTKSRRKSSTPRKLQCTKSYNASSCDLDSPIKNNVNTEANIDIESSDTDQIALRWSDEGSLDSKMKESPVKAAVTDSEDINKIQEFIVSTGMKESDRASDGALQRDLMKRGFDSETAKIIERDLLEDTPLQTEISKSRTLISVEIVETTNREDTPEKTTELSNKPPNVQEESDDDGDELSVHENNEECSNFFCYQYDDKKHNAKDTPPQTKLKDNLMVEVCIEDISVILRPSPFSIILDQNPLTVEEIDYSYKETEQAVESISNIDRLYTPLKDSYKTKCYEIFDSTLTSIDTPLKDTSSLRTQDVSVTELVRAKDTDNKDNINNRKRGRSSSSESANSSKRAKPDADLLLKAANIQNIDIETVLTKLHGH